MEPPSGMTRSGSLTSGVMRSGSIASNIIRTGSAWRASGRDVFSQNSSYRDEVDDEEALKWAALEKLPTYDRIRKGILSASTGYKEVDVDELGSDDKRKLMERLVRVAEEDNEKFLRKLKNRLDLVGIENPTIEVRYENLDIGAEAYVGSSGVPTALNFFTNNIEGFLNALHILPSRKKPINILNNISGIVKPSSAEDGSVMRSPAGTLTFSRNSMCVTGPPRNSSNKQLRGIDVNMNKMPDVAMTLAVVALYADGPTAIRDVASWRVKETERMISICTEFRKLGATVEEGLIIALSRHRRN